MATERKAARGSGELGRSGLMRREEIFSSAGCGGEETRDVGRLVEGRRRNEWTDQAQMNTTAYQFLEAAR